MKNAKAKLYEIIFEHNTRAGKLFDIVLIILVLLSVLTVMLETVQSLWLPYRDLFYQVEWLFTLIFSFELILRLYSTPTKLKYMLSFYGLIDIIAVLPTYLAIFIPGAQAFLIVRAMRLLRVFRILKLNHYTNAGTQLHLALSASRPKIIVFMFFVVTLVTIVGTAMYFIEGRENGYTSIPKSIYWAIVTMTTVGYGDITPLTTAGQFLSALLMITGYGVIAVPTGIISSEMTKLKDNSTQGCESCRPHPLANANYCSQCGTKIKNWPS